MVGTTFNPVGKNPFLLLRGWFDEACTTEISDPGAMTLASVAENGWPSARIVLMKGIDDHSVHFYTNYTSRKAIELEATKMAALCFHWKSLRRQVRMVGHVSRLDEASSDAYFASRPYESCIGAWASDQSAPLKSREVLEENLAQFTEKYPQNPPRPKHWGGYRLTPVEFEFWQEGQSRLHDRFRFTKDGDEVNNHWIATRLYP